MSDVRQQSFVGEIKKCPSCGAEVKSFSAFCSDCGHEFRVVQDSGSLKEFTNKLFELQESAEYYNDPNLINFIKTFPIPNTKEDLFEFLLLSSSNIESYNVPNDLTEAWRVKFNQAYQKAQLSLGNTAELQRIEALNKQIQEKYKKMKKKDHRGNALWAILSIVGLILGIAFYGWIFVAIKSCVGN